MTGSPGVSAAVSVVVEGPTDEAVVRRLLAHVGCPIGPVYGRMGRSFVQSRVSAFNEAARHAPWFVLVDLDRDQCAPALAAVLLPCPSAHMILRVAVREVESWLLADREGIATFLGVRVGWVPTDPEALSDPKAEIVQLARRSRRTAIREDLVPRPSSGRPTGHAYVARIEQFVESVWSPDAAAQHSDSLARCLRRLRELTPSA